MSLCTDPQAQMSLCTGPNVFVYRSKCLCTEPNVFVYRPNVFVYRPKCLCVQTQISLCTDPNAFVYRPNVCINQPRRTVYRSRIFVYRPHTFAYTLCTSVFRPLPTIASRRGVCVYIYIETRCFCVHIRCLGVHISQRVTRHIFLSGNMSVCTNSAFVAYTFVS